MKPDLYTVDIDVMEIPCRATPHLLSAGCTSAGILDAMTDAEILAIPGIGKKLLGDIRKAVDIARRSSDAGGE